MLSYQPSTLRVLVVDDHELTRFSLKLALSSQENIELVGLASNGQEAIEMVKRYHPDVIILDLQMPVMDGWCASAHIKDIEPKTQIIAYSSQEDTKLKGTTRTNSLDAFCKKDTATPELIKLVKELGQRVASQQNFE
jgi:DNA-binding NarL/FixJ family response regulator